MFKPCISILVSCLSLSPLLLADGPSSPTQQDIEPEDLFISPQEKSKTPSSEPSETWVPTSSSFIRRFNAYGDMLYWKASDSSTHWGLKIDTTNSPFVTEDKYAFTFDWDFGFRLGFDYLTPWNELLLDLNWTRFYTRSTNVHQDLSILANFTSIQSNAVKFYLNLMSSSLTLAGNPYKITADYSIHWDQVDFNIKKKLPLAKRFVLTPFGGIRFLASRFALNLAYYTDYWGTTEVSQPPTNFSTMNLKNTFLAIGILGGFQGDLDLGRGFGLFFMGNGFIGSASGKASNEGNAYTASTTPTASRLIHMPRNTILKTMIDISAGIDWQKSFYKERIALMLMAAYELHVLFSSPDFVYDSNFNNSTTDPSTNFQLQGMTIRAGLQF